MVSEDRRFTEIVDTDLSDSCDAEQSCPMALSYSGFSLGCMCMVCTKLLPLVGQV